MPTDNTHHLDRALRAMAHANRRAILAAIRSGPHPVGRIAEEVGLSQQVTSHHLGVLRRARLARSTWAGKQHLFSIDSDGWAAVQSFLDDFWPTRLAALKTAVEAHRRGSDG